MKKNLLVTLSDKNFINQAKQLFSSVYWNAGWKGDYMLLSQNVPEKDLIWFRERGILVKKCKLIYSKKEWRLHPLVFNKLYLFTTYFKRWKRVLFLDADIMVNASLNKLLKKKGFNAVKDLPNPRIYGHFRKKNSKNKKYFDKIEKKYDLNSPAFNVGVMSFETDIIERNTFSELKDLLKKYHQILLLPEQAILNIYFSENWNRLPFVYNSFTYFFLKNNPNPLKIKAIILHSVYKYKFWIQSSPFFEKWSLSLKKADFINFNIPQKAKIWKPFSVYLFSFIYELTYYFYLFKDKKRNKLKQNVKKNIGKGGLYLRKYFPRTYFYLKNFF